MTKQFWLALTSLAACATLNNRLVGVSEDDSKAAIAQKDYPKLQGMCTGAIKIRTGIANRQDDTCDAAFAIALDQKDLSFMRPLCGRRGEMFGARYAKACSNSLTIAGDANDLATLHALCDHDKFEPACRNLGQREAFGDLDHPDCAKLPAQFEAARKTSLKSEDAAPEELARPVIALARCNHAEVIFEQVTHIGSERGPGAFGTRVLLAAEKLDSAALFAAYQGYVKAHTGHALFGPKFQSFSANHVGTWLFKANHLDQCQTLVGASAGSDRNAQYGLLDYFVSTQCAAAAPQLAELLSSNEPEVREDACLALGQLGSAAELPKVRIIAESDRTNRVVERPDNSGIYVKDYFVADACSKAAGQISLRNGSSPKRHASR